MTTNARALAEEAFDREGLTPETWSNEGGYTYAEHVHPYHKVLFCLEGSIVFHTREGDIELSAGDRLDLPAGTAHSASVGSEGVTCIEASRP